MKDKIINIAQGDYTSLDLEIINGKYYITAYGDGVARLEITEETYTEILHDKEWGVDNV
jgi:hypothetical protein